MRRKSIALCVEVILVMAIPVGCRSVPSTGVETTPPWDVDRAQVIRWNADHPSFEQGFALEASGLAVAQEVLIVPSEKYGRLLLVELSEGSRVGTLILDVPRHAELEGVALVADGVLLCDEAHAAVYEIAMGHELPLSGDGAEKPLAVKRLDLEGVDVRGGKIGFEGIEVDSEGRIVYLLLERSGSDATGCGSRIWSLQRRGGLLQSMGGPIEVGLEDCAWRLTGLAWWGERLVALKTQFPGERYEVVAVDRLTGDTEVVIDLTDLLRSLAREGWSNNVEGIAVGDDGSLWLVADNAVTGVIDDPLPPPGDARTLLLRLPPTTVD